MFTYNFEPVELVVEKNIFEVQNVAIETERERLMFTAQIVRGDGPTHPNWPVRNFLSDHNIYIHRILMELHTCSEDLGFTLEGAQNIDQIRNS